MITRAQSTFEQQQNTAKPDIISVNQLLLDNASESIKCAIPALVEEYDRTRNIAKIQPAPSIKNPDGTYTKRAAMWLPVWNFGGGGFIINFPLQKGDSGFIIASDVDTSAFWAKKEEYNPATIGQHKYEFGWFVPDVRSYSEISISPEDDNKLVIQNLNGSTKFTISQNGEISLTANKLKVSAPLSEFTGDITVGGISFLSHVHGGVQSGDATTTIPQ